MQLLGKPDAKLLEKITPDVSISIIARVINQSPYKFISGYLYVTNLPKFWCKVLTHRYSYTAKIRVLGLFAWLLHRNAKPKIFVQKKLVIGQIA